MPDRDAALVQFLDAAGWSDAERRPLAGDASARRYLRLRRDGERAVAMDADPDRGESVAPFLRAGAHLLGLGLSAPRIIAADREGGFLLMEDFGDAVFARLMAADPAAAEGLYAAAVDLLATLHAAPPPDWAARYDAAAMAAAIRPAWDWVAGAPGRRPGRDWLAFEAGFAEELARSDGGFVLLHRDYHAENLIALPERRGVASVGLLDFQDALAGHPAYDLASLLQDARRDVGTELEARMVARFLDATGHAAGPFHRSYAVQAAQRHVRILGIFARLARAAGKTGYLALVPRVRAYLARDLAHPDLAELRRLAERALPAPALA